MSYDLDRSSGIFDQGLFGLAAAFGETADGLGAVESITSVSPRTRSTSVLAMQRDLIVLGLLPTTGADGFIGPNTTTALARATFALGRSEDPNSAVTHFASGAITVPDALLEALHAAAIAGKFPSQSAPGVPPVPASVPAPLVTPNSVPFDANITTGPGKTFDTPATPGAPPAPPSGDGMLPATTSATSSSKWLPIAVIAGGAVLIAGVAYVATRKKPAPAKNPRRRRRARRAR